MCLTSAVTRWLVVQGLYYLVAWCCGQHLMFGTAWGQQALSFDSTGLFQVPPLAAFTAPLCAAVERSAAHGRPIGLGPLGLPDRTHRAHHWLQMLLPSPGTLPLQQPPTLAALPLPFLRSQPSLCPRSALAACPPSHFCPTKTGAEITKRTMCSIAQAAFWVHQLLVLYIEEWRKDVGM